MHPFIFYYIYNWFVTPRLVCSVNELFMALPREIRAYILETYMLPEITPPETLDISYLYEIRHIIKCLCGPEYYSIATKHLVNIFTKYETNLGASVLKFVNFYNKKGTIIYINNLSEPILIMSPAKLYFDNKLVTFKPYGPFIAVIYCNDPNIFITKKGYLKHIDLYTIYTIAETATSLYDFHDKINNEFEGLIKCSCSREHN